MRGVWVSMWVCMWCGCGCVCGCVWVCVGVGVCVGMEEKEEENQVCVDTGRAELHEVPTVWLMVFWKQPRHPTPYCTASW